MNTARIESRIQPVWLLALLAATLLLALLALFAEGLGHMLGAWGSADYSHAWLIGPIALYMAWQRRQALYDLFASHRVSALPGAWWGLGFLVLSLMLTFVGELATL